MVVGLVMRYALMLVACAVTFGSVAAVAAVADARPGPPVRAGIHLSSSYGYVLSILGDGDEVSIEAQGLHGTTKYSVRGRVSPRGIWANFGRLGKLAVEFHPNGSITRRVPPSRCKGKTRVTRLGAFVGEIRFNGEHGYTQVDAHRGAGVLYVRRPWRCPRRPAAKGPVCRPDRQDSGESIWLSADSPKHRASLTVIADRPADEPGFTLFMADASEQRGRIAIARHASASASPSTLTYDSDLGLAQLMPPLPFTLPTFAAIRMALPCSSVIYGCLCLEPRDWHWQDPHSTRV
jgi:hypothetical protein